MKKKYKIHGLNVLGIEDTIEADSINITDHGDVAFVVQTTTSKPHPEEEGKTLTKVSVEPVLILAQGKWDAIQKVEDSE